MIIVYRLCFLLAVAGLAFVDAIRGGNSTDVRINNGPLIIPRVSEITLQKGQNFTLTCKGVTKLRFRQQDVSEEVTSNFTIVNVSSPISEEDFSFQTTLTLYNVDQYAIGYYACSDEFVNENIVNTITEDPENTEHVSYIYVYVNGTGNLFAPMRELIMSRSNKILIECRPTTPDVEITLSPLKSQNKTPKYSPKVGFILNKFDSFAYTCQGQRGNITEKKRIRIISVIDPPMPQIAEAQKRFLPGDNITLNCTVNITRNNIVDLSWMFYRGSTMEPLNSDITNKENVTEGEVYNTLEVINATINNAGNYTCVSSYGVEKKESNRVEKIYIPKEYLNLRIKNKPKATRQKKATLVVELDGHPAPNFTILRNGERLLTDTEKYNITYKTTNFDFVLNIYSLNVADNANYTVIASNGIFNTSATHNLEVGAEPVISFGVGDKTCVKGSQASLRCDVSGYPLPNISWMISYNGSQQPKNSDSVIKTSTYNETAILDVRCLKTGKITCLASNKYQSNVSESRRLLVFEMENGFGISTISDKGEKWVSENDLVSLQCLASLYVFSNVTWEINDDIKPGKIVEYPNPTEFSHVAELKIKNITLNDGGKYKCVGVKNDQSVVTESIQINVLELHPPIIMEHFDDLADEDVHRYKKISRKCIATGVPMPEVQWYKDNNLLIANKSNVNIYQKKLNRTTVNITIEINGMQSENVGTYECVAKSTTNVQKKSFKLNLEKVDQSPNKMITNYLIAIAVIVLILIILILYLTLKVRKEKKFRKELAAAGLLYFETGVVNSLNPELGVDEQAELLPYNKKFEFPLEKLHFGTQLGAGAFGVVYKAEARGIIDAEETTIVAVKTVKKTADNMYIKALASELKIMVHLGKHINIVNLLGACTKNVGKRELAVIVEYCLYGNIHNYMQRHREVFIDQLNTDNKEKLGKVNRAYTSTSSGSSGVQSEYFGSTNTQDTDHTFLNTANTAQSVRKNIPKNQPMEDVKASEGYVNPEWRSNYESDYSYNGRSPRPLTSRDLLAWAFQIARGMEYLASRKVLHGDLAARNILLAEDNIVKICDFGLAKSVYKNEEYHSKPNCLLPVKWLALECITDRIFSTQSDVWSFGIVLWELFSLAKTPYPNINPGSLVQFLTEGHRLNKPAYADDRLYGVMNRCWDAKPTLRPTFSQLQALLGTFLEDDVRNHYVDLNSSYMDKNAKVEGQEDYLDMMCAPDYNNMVTPSPHHYVNEKSFFPPTPLRVDEGGYLQMSPTNQGVFSPRLPSSEFDFDPRKFNPKTSEASSCGSELTPMLTLNNLPARSGSESDHENNVPHTTVCSRIDEEADEVFAPSLETKNARNMLQSAVTNPTYITFDNIDEKPKDINYVNINVPNGLVTRP